MIPKDARILISNGIRRELARIKAVAGARDWWAGMSRQERGRTSQAYVDSLEQVVEYSPQLWLGRPATVTERQRISRELSAMERDGLLERIGTDTRTTHVRWLGEV